MEVAELVAKHHDVSADRARAAVIRFRELEGVKVGDMIYHADVADTAEVVWSQDSLRQESCEAPTS